MIFQCGWGSNESWYLTNKSDKIHIVNMECISCAINTNQNKCPQVIQIIQI